ncbi:MAG: hypothetical protein ABI183_04255 [Polyangiaceae bacterium]
MTLRELRPAVAIVFSLALTGCIFLVDSLPDGTSTTCQLTTPAYSSGTSACKTCITGNCQKLLDVCCGDSSCQAQLNNVDSCANQDGCSALAKAGGTEGATSDLISCIANACGTDCYGIDAGPADGSTSTCTDCRTSCVRSAADHDCTCVSPTSSTPANNVTCDDETFTSLVCCASNGWPSVANATCACETLYCDDNGGGGICTCQLGVSGSGDVSYCYPSSAPTCCISADKRTCTCDLEESCDQAGETSVDHCGTDTTQCPMGGSRPNLVSTCSE